MRYQIIRHEHIFTPEKWFKQCHASTLCMLPDGTLATAWFGGDHEKAPNVAIWFSKCPKNGKWSDPVKVADRENIPQTTDDLFQLLAEGGDDDLFAEEIEDDDFDDFDDDDDFADTDEVADTSDEEEDEDEM